MNDFSEEDGDVPRRFALVFAGAWYNWVVEQRDSKKSFLAFPRSFLYDIEQQNLVERGCIYK